LKKKTKHLIVLGILFVTILGGFYYKVQINMRNNHQLPDIRCTEQCVGPQAYSEIIRYEVKKNDFILNVLLRWGFAKEEIFSFVGVSTQNFSFNKMKPGDSLFVFTNWRDRLSKIILKSNQYTGAIFEKTTEDEVKAWEWTQSLTCRDEMVRGRIESSLYETILDSGETAELVCLFADIFAWQIDFLTDVKQGDTYYCLVEKYYSGKEFAKYGRILYAGYTNNGKDFTAAGFQLPGEKSLSYYDTEGRSLQRSFLKSPLKFKRISSGFTHSRYHPVLKIYRPHLGVDYAAPTGTPVWSTATGRVTFAGYRGQIGKAVIIRHAGGYETIYGHLSSIANGIVPGASVAQGQFIGRVGSTGLSSGPHLDYRVKRNNVFINPLTINPPSMVKLPDSLMDNFKATCQSNLKRINQPPNGSAAYAQIGRDPSL